MNVLDTTQPCCTGEGMTLAERMALPEFEPKTSLLPNEAGCLHGVRIVELPDDVVDQLEKSPFLGLPDRVWVGSVAAVRSLKESRCWIPVYRYQNLKGQGTAPVGRLVPRYSAFEADEESMRGIYDSHEFEPPEMFIEDPGAYPAKTLGRYRGALLVKGW